MVQQQTLGRVTDVKKARQNQRRLILRVVECGGTNQMQRVGVDLTTAPAWAHLATVPAYFIHGQRFPRAGVLHHVRRRRLRAVQAVAEGSSLGPGTQRQEALLGQVVLRR